jgi:hypothetical protein
MIKEILTKWDYPEKEGFYWVFDSDFNDWIIAKYQNGKFYASGSDEIEISKTNEFNSFLRYVKKYKYISKPKN